jgi:hypothetical protein
LVCVSAREEIRYPSVLLQPLGHLSVLFEIERSLAMSAPEFSWAMSVS